MRASLINKTCPTHGPLGTDVYSVRNKANTKIYIHCGKCARARSTKWYWENQRHCIDRTRNYNRKLREELIAAYGGCCECCGEDHFEFLTLDHTNGNGAEEKRKLFGNARSGTHFFQYLKKHGYPKDGYRLLCFNCNCARGFYGFCPHNPEDTQDVDRSRMRQRGAA